MQDPQPPRRDRPERTERRMKDASLTQSRTKDRDDPVSNAHSRRARHHRFSLRREPWLSLPCSSCLRLQSARDVWKNAQAPRCPVQRHQRR
jgi:hypothetical protein